MDGQIHGKHEMSESFHHVAAPYPFPKNTQPGQQIAGIVIFIAGNYSPFLNNLFECLEIEGVPYQEPICFDIVHQGYST